ncbi:hypothetical protein DFR70_104472 [Nocardia tenerifensis]|uniref:Uncharacterized protein n=1 Tax=Nocardia tenerifensis TaxID=228006 RepID=A0A318K5W8_9NOCA|nr:hypothetical protein [Nocardia tenerifensis]PXX65408.1 hypothetical protein DFR70_104472 [Nocardia tenerifensis]
MPWFQVDDQLGFHPKAVAAGNAAMGLWVRAGSWSMQQLTEGFVPAAIVRGLGSAAQAKKLVEVGLWTTADGGYRFHDWAERQMSKAEIEDRRRKRADAGRKGGQVSGQARQLRAQANAAAKAETPPPAITSTPPSRPMEQTPKRKPTPVPAHGLESASRGARSVPPRQCVIHRGHPAPPPCGACADARRARERWDAAHGDDLRADAVQRRAAARNCVMCDDAGWRHPPAELLAVNSDPPVLRCDHQTVTSLDHWHTTEEEATP